MNQPESYIKVIINKYNPLHSLKVQLNWHMKCSYYFLWIIVLCFTVSCRSQLVLTVNDIQKLKENEARFINKPLRKLLREIKPHIRLAIAQENRPDGMLNYILFRFVSADEYYKNSSKRKFAGITVFVKENFEWDYARSAEGKSYDWSKSDEKKYGGLTVVDFWVSREK